MVSNSSLSEYFESDNRNVDEDKKEPVYVPETFYGLSADDLDEKVKNCKYPELCELWGVTGEFVKEVQKGKLVEF